MPRVDNGNHDKHALQWRSKNSDHRGFPGHARTVEREKSNALAEISAWNARNMTSSVSIESFIVSTREPSSRLQWHLSQGMSQDLPKSTIFNTSAKSPSTRNNSISQSAFHFVSRAATAHPQSTSAQQATFPSLTSSIISYDSWKVPISTLTQILKKMEGKAWKGLQRNRWTSKDLLPPTSHYQTFPQKQ